MRTIAWAGWMCVGVAVLTAACGGDESGGGPTSATPTAASIAVTLTNPLRMGETAQAAGTVTLSNGQTQPVTTGWRSDAPAVATATDAGLVTAVGNGRATIFVVTGGRQGQQVVRVVPDYQGQWSGLLRVTSCTQTGAWASIGFCDEFPVGSSDGFGLGFTQAGESVTARANYGTSFLFSPVTASIEPEGGVAFSTSATASSGIVIDGSWRVRSDSRGALNGTVTEAWRVAGVSGEGRLVQDIVGAVRSATSSAATSGLGKARMQGGRLRLQP